jgi:hypothetical protein
MSIDGHWTIRFASIAKDGVQRESGGILTFRAGHLFGGDAWSYYSGKYRVIGSQMTFRLAVAIHFTKGGMSILGGPLVPCTLVGSAELSRDHRRLKASVHVAGDESVVMIAILSKVLELNDREQPRLRAGNVVQMIPAISSPGRESVPWVNRPPG